MIIILWYCDSVPLSLPNQLNNLYEKLLIEVEEIGTHCNNFVFVNKWPCVS